MYQAAQNRYNTLPTRRCGNSGLLLPAVSLGLWHNFGDTFPYENMRALCRTAFDNGIPLSWDGHLVQTRWRQWAVQAISMPACFCCWLGLQQVSALLCHNTGVLNGMMNCAACWEHF